MLVNQVVDWILSIVRSYIAGIGSDSYMPDLFLKFSKDFARFRDPYINFHRKCTVKVSKRIQSIQSCALKG